MGDVDQMDRIERLLLAIAALLAVQHENDDNGEGRRPELLLHSVGLSLNEIAAILGRSPEAVRSTIRRSQRGASK
jgi:DNA-directed RNA polymerase specialized sigma24 family protein